MKKCLSCNKTKEPECFNKLSRSKDGLQYKCKLCFSEWYSQNKQRILDAQKSYYALNKEKKKEYQSKNAERRRKYIKDVHQRYRDEGGIPYLSARVRTLINTSIRRGGYGEKAQRTKDILGCTWEKLKIHLEDQFSSGMTWGNRSRWHIDHIVPLSHAKSDDEFYRLCHYTNLQPLWAKDNLSKGSKIDYCAHKTPA